MFRHPEGHGFILRQNPFYEGSVYVGEPVVTSLKPVREAFVIKPQEMKQRRIQIVYMNRIPGDVEAEFIAFAVNVAFFQTTAR